MSFLHALKSSSPLLAAALLMALLTTAPAQAQRRKPQAATAGGTPPPTTRLVRLQPLFGGLKPDEATRLIGAAQLDAIAASFASRAEASTFLSNKGYEYLIENQPDTAAYRFNLAWLLNPQNADAYRGLGLLASAQPTPDASIALLAQALALAPTNAAILNDLGSSYINRYLQTRKKKDLAAGTDFLQRGLAADATNAEAWQQLARAYYYQEKYPQAWEAVHNSQTQRLSSLDFSLISDLLAKQPDPQGKFK